MGVQPGNAQWNLDWVRKSQHAHGVSVRHMRLANGKWEPVLDSPFSKDIDGVWFQDPDGDWVNVQIAEAAFKRAVAERRFNLLGHMADAQHEPARAAGAGG